MDNYEPTPIPTIHCPHCERALDRGFLLESAGKIISRLRKTAGGPEKVYYACGCGFVESAKKFRAHKCSVKPPRGSERPASPEQREEYHRGTRISTPDGVCC
jgi:hypothetical protein